MEHLRADDLTGFVMPVPTVSTTLTRLRRLADLSASIDSRTELNPFLRKLRNGPALTEADEAALSELFGPSRLAGRGDLRPEGSGLQSILLIVQGWACRYKQLENGKRQITSIYLSGDLCEPFGVAPPRDVSLAAMTSIRFCSVMPSALRDLARGNLRIEEALWWDLLMFDAISREHMLSLGRRSATERLGHFFCEMHTRLRMIGKTERYSYDFPLTQNDLADLFGLSVVHVNRSIQELRALGLISLRERRLTIHDVAALRDFSMFDEAYLRAATALP